MFKKLRRSIRKRIALVRPHKRKTVLGIDWQLDCREIIDLATYWGGWEPKSIALFHSKVKPSDVVLEIGANVGAHTLVLAKIVGPQGKVHAVEPTRYARAKLLRNLKLNPDLAERVAVLDYLITDTDDHNVRRSIQSSWSATPRIARQEDEVVESETISIDHLAERLGLDKCDFLKIDIDGYDLRALRGAERLLTEFKPRIFIELCDTELRKNGGTLAELVALLGSHNYRGYDLDTTQPIDEAYLSGLPPRASRNGYFYVEDEVRLRPA